MFKCLGCEVEQPLSEYRKSKKGKNGHSTRCKTCLKTYHNNYLKGFDPTQGHYHCGKCSQFLVVGSNWTIAKARNMKLVCKPCSVLKSATNRKVYPETYMHALAKQRAASKGLEFNITPRDIVIPPTCPVLGIPLSHGRGKPHDGSPTLDRIVPHKGYVRGNIMVISHKANRLKGAATLQELQAIVAYIEQFNGE